MPLELHPIITEGFHILMERDGWANARDVKAVYEAMCSNRECRLDDNDETEGPYCVADVQGAVTKMRLQRPLRHVKSETPATAPHVTEAQLEVSMQCAPTAQIQAAALAVPKYEVQELEEAEEEREKEEEEEESGNSLEPEDVWSPLEDALTELGYDIYTTAQVLQSGRLPEDIVNLVATKVDRTAGRVRPMLEAQCKSILPRILKVIEAIKIELERQRLAQLAIQKADEVEKERLLILERQFEKEALAVKLQMIGRCCAGYQWIKVEGGYCCSAGGHYVSDAML